MTSIVGASESALARYSAFGRVPCGAPQVRDLVREDQAAGCATAIVMKRAESFKAFHDPARTLIDCEIFPRRHHSDVHTGGGGKSESTADGLLCASEAARWSGNR